MANHEPLGTFSALALHLRPGAPRAASARRVGTVVVLVLVAMLAHGVLVRPLVMERERLDDRLTAIRNAPEPEAGENRSGAGALSRRAGRHGRVLEHRARPSGEHELTVATDGRGLAALLAELAGSPASGRPLELRLTAGDEGNGTLRLELRLDIDGAVARAREESVEDWRWLPSTLFAPLQNRSALQAMAGADLRFVGVLRSVNGEPRALIASDRGRLWNRGAGERLGPWSVERVAADFVALRRREGHGTTEPLWLRLGLGSDP